MTQDLTTAPSPSLPPSLRPHAALAAAALAAALSAACVAEPGTDEALPPPDSLAETEQGLSMSAWSGATQVSSGVWYAQVATVGNTTYMVHSGTGNQLSLRTMVGSSWTVPVAISGQTSSKRVSLAAFNGYLYMIRTDVSVTTKLWLSRYSPATGQWTTSYQLSQPSAYGPPAMVAFNNRLYLIGVTPSSNKLWMASMDSSETLSVATPMEGHYSAARVSATVFACKLYIAHRAGTTNTVVYNSFNGSAWGADRTIPAGPSGAAIVATEPVIAARSGYLHLLRRDISGTDVPVWWTYFNNSSWSAEVSLGSGVSTTYAPSLTNGGPGLVAVTTTYYNSIASSLQYTLPLQPYPLLCGGIITPL